MLKLRSVLIGQLLLTGPAIAAIVVLPFFGWRTFGPSEFMYFVLGGVALAWQWYSLVLPSWKKWLMGRGVRQADVDNLSRCAGLAWPTEQSAIGLFAIHTATAALCGIHFGPWLIRRYVWIMPFMGRSTHVSSINDYLEHFEILITVPAVLVGYVLSRHFRKFATCAWILPTIKLAYELVKFAEPARSVLAPHSSTRFQYFFEIQRTIPPFFGGGDFVRIALQMTTVAPFYAGVAYTAGAVAGSRDVLHKVFSRPELDVSRTDESELVRESEKPVQELTGNG